jgi:GTPase SAR1 family protein
MKIIKGHLNAAVKVVVYGTEGIGKTTFASQFPRPIFIDTEGGTTRYNVERFEAPQSWRDILDAVNYIIANDTPYKTLVIDTADKAEALCIDYICKQNGEGRVFKKHLMGKWNSIYDNYGCHAVMNRFFAELSDTYRQALVDYAIKFYAPTAFHWTEEEKEILGINK